MTPASDSEGYAPLYRGHADAAYQLEPTAYRVTDGMSFRAVEHHLYEELMRLDPVAFASDRSVFERLVRMQHYGLPTRLLDLTHSPLIALFFACGSHEEKDGEVLLFPWKREEIYQPSDIPDVSFAGVRVQADFPFIGRSIVKGLQAFFDEETKVHSGHAALDQGRKSFLHVLIEAMDKLSEIDFLTQAAAIQFIEEKTVSDLIVPWRERLALDRKQLGQTQEALAICDAEAFLDRFHKRLIEQAKFFIDQLCRKLKIENNTEQSSLGKFLSQFTHFYFVYAPVSNERIRRQQGAFIVCPPARTSLWTVEHHRKSKRIRVKGNAKKEIMWELADVGVTRSYVFPELPEQAAEAKRRYPARPDPI